MLIHLLVNVRYIKGGGVTLKMTQQMANYAKLILGTCDSPVIAYFWNNIINSSEANG